MRAEVRGGRGREAVLALLAAVVACCSVGLVMGPAPAPAHDTVRYLDYALGLHDAGVFGLRDAAGMHAPGRANAPLYPAVLAAIMALDAGFAESARCHVLARGDCPVRFGALLLTQLGLAAATLWLVFLSARRLLGPGPWSWIAAVLVLFSAEPVEYAHKPLTENLVIPLTAALFYLIVRAADTRRGGLAVGFVLGLLALTRPEYAYLAYALALGLAALALRRGRALARFALLLAIGFATVALPWMARNAAQFGQWSITGGYAGPTLHQRLAYDRMPWPEIGMAFIYWFPDFGDSLGRRLAGPAVADRLDWGPSSYYHQATLEFSAHQDGVAGADAAVLRRLIDAHLLAAPGKYLAVSLALAWRGLFVAKLWGVLGAAATVSLLVTAAPAERRRFALAAAPFLLLVAFYAAVSVSVPRYNLGLLSVYAIAMTAWLARRWAGRAGARA
jgi:4-amino-4-deoxy-L-arabinose transferase-like glycosyltransferase